MRTEHTAAAPKPAVRASATAATGRRGFLAGLAGLAAAGAAVAQPAPAEAVSYAPQPYTATQIPTAEELHVIRRWTYGYRPAQLDAVRAAGGASAWFEAQLEWEGVAESDRGAEVDGWWECIGATPAEIVARHDAKTELGWQAMDNYARYVLVKRMESERQVLELMTEFWEDHLYVPRGDDGVHPFRIEFGHGIRERALTSFEELLRFSTVHPAMSCSLDNAASTKRRINENLGRELLELHTVGQGNYTEDDVKHSARLLTGYRVDMWRTWAVSYSANDHYTGEVRIMEFEHPNADADGRPAVNEYLSYLARHPQTAQRIARKLAQRFVRDDPSQQLVDELAAVYLQHDTAVKPVLRALFAHEEFRGSTGAKVKTPTDEVVAVFRALEARFERPRSEKAGAIQLLWLAKTIGTTPFSHPRPDGPPLLNGAWASPSRFLGSWNMHWEAAHGWYPSVDMRYVKNGDRLPRSGLPMAQFVDHLSRTLIGEPSTAALLEACCLATQAKPADQLSTGHAVLGWKLGRVLAAVLNQPNFYLR